jgi:LPPG:FO 2-phospho-L-lactate transferase
MILERAAAPVDGVAFRGADAARPTAEVLRALAGADAIVIGPSNPVASIRPILAVPGMSEAIAGAAAPVVAVSPFVGGRSVKGPTEDFCRWAGLPAGTECAFQAYADLIDGVVADEPAEGYRVHITETLMDTPERRRRLAEETLEFATGLGR